MLRLATWNCKMALRRKLLKISSIAPDILIVPECENPDIFSPEEYKPIRQAIWKGDTPRKGLAVFSLSSDYAISLMEDAYDPSIRYVLPVSVTGPINFTL